MFQLIFLFNLFVSLYGFKYTNEALNDQVIHLPGLNYNPNFSQFSGYLILPNTEKYIHYWLVESEQVPNNDPLVFWTNGGPGCSGLLGFMTEQGPFKPDEYGILNENPYAWNKIANMVFLEQPVGVGFSYSNNETDYHLGDSQAALDNLNTILIFLERFPHFKTNPLYITSESYGGHYMPTLAYEIIQYNDAHNNKLNFKGFAVGNPYTDHYSGLGAQMETYWGKQLLPKPLWDKYINANCLQSGQILTNKICLTLIMEFNKLIGNLNPYALDFPVCVSEQQFRMYNLLYDTQDSYEYQPCIDKYATSYLNQLDVKKALHVKNNIYWRECSYTLRYHLADKMLPMEKYYPLILNSKTHPNLRILVYSGDDDGVCGTIGTQRWIYSLGYDVSSLWETWYVDGQTSGYITRFKTPYSEKSRFTFMTVHGAGHEVPTYKPKEALKLFQMYLNEEI
jgi:carboxypeptidase C (cathepsin A)